MRPAQDSPLATTWSLPLPKGRALELGRRPLVMGVLNVTPDSFSDGGLFLEPDRAVERALQLLEEGADILDLGAESTRPGGGVYGDGAEPVPTDVELSRLLPVLERLRPLTTAPLSVDTRKGEVARLALAAGADLINDVSALADPRTAETVAAAGCPLVLMHSRGELRTMQRRIEFADLLADVRAELSRAVARATASGIERRCLILDPGIGFGKTSEQNLALLRHLGELSDLGLPLLVGASRKAFLGAVSTAPAHQRLGGSMAAAAWAVLQGAAILRVHDVRHTVEFLSVWRAVAEAGPQ